MINVPLETPISGEGNDLDLHNILILVYCTFAAQPYPCLLHLVLFLVNHHN